MRPNRGLCQLSILLLTLCVFNYSARSQERALRRDDFRQLEELLPTPTSTRTASGAPGHAYWQQRADHDIKVELDDKRQSIIGSERIRYQNNSPDTLRYLWLQLDPNIFARDADSSLAATAPGLGRVTPGRLRGYLARARFDGGVKLGAVRDAKGKRLAHTVVKTMMRIDLREPLVPGASCEFSVDWSYAINDSKLVRGRTGYEYFPKEDNHIYEIAQWFPRMASYTDVNGWHHKQYLGRGEFTLEFGDYKVAITVPADHIVASTGVLQNPEEVLSEAQRKRLAEAETAKTPMFIVTPEEARKNQTEHAKGKKTWVFEAKNVRDFAFASSRKFIWDAQGHEVGEQKVMAMSYYPNEGEPLWSKYSTHAIIHTLDVYSRYTFNYPYPVAISVNGPVGGMEYPMICFNGPRPEKDGSYSKRTKYGLISVIIHEVGHNYFPMIINSDERQWTWMDEGLNTFVQFLTEQEWEQGYPSRRGEPKNIVPYMASDAQMPIMTNSESILQFGSNAYAKPATALNILRESILGRELFDFAFKEYARRWKFKRPMPADFFRTMEDASGVDLDWFWRGWFYSTDRCDIALRSVRVLELDNGDPVARSRFEKQQRAKQPRSLSRRRNEPLDTRIEAFPELSDFYNSYDELDVTEPDRAAFKRFVASLDEAEKKVLETPMNFYLVELENVGGLVMPVVLQLDTADGGREELRLPAELWRRSSDKVTKLIMTPRTITRVTLDPHLESADTDLSNNVFPPEIERSRFKLFKDGRGKNPMQKARAAAKAEQARAKKAKQTLR